MRSETEAIAVLEEAWEKVRTGRGCVLRLTGSGARGAASRWFRGREERVDSWVVGDLPDEERRAIWFDDGPAQVTAADFVLATVTLLDVPWLVVLTGDSVGAGPGRTERVEVSGEEAEPVGVVRLQGDLVEVPDDADQLEEGLLRAVSHGRSVEASGWFRRLERVDSERSRAHRWTWAARCHNLLRQDAMAETRALRGEDDWAGAAALLLHAASLVGVGERYGLVEAAAARAETRELRADAWYRLDRHRMSYGSLAADELRWPASVHLTAEMLYFQLEKVPWGSRESAEIAAQLRALPTDIAGLYLHIASCDVETTTLEGWVDCARRQLGFGLLERATFDLAGKVMAPGAPELAARIQRGLDRLPGRISVLPRLDQAISSGDWQTARKLAQELTEGVLTGGFLPVVAAVVEAAACAVLEGDTASLVSVESEALVEYMQPAFPELIEAAVGGAPVASKARLLALAASWWERLQHEGLAACLARIEELPAGGPIPLGDYDLIERIGSGGMGEVWRGVHAGLGEPVAVKILRSEAAGSLELFLEEVELTAALDHQAIVQVHDAGVVSQAAAAASGGELTARTPFLVMELVEDGSLLQLREPLDWPGVKAILLAVLDALAHAHARGVVHRDLKPDNVLVKRGQELQIRLSDFGLAGLADVRKVSGTPAYMAPEQFGRSVVGPSVDLYAVGCLATYLLTGAPPFAGTVQGLAMAHRFQQPAALPALGLPDGVDAWRTRLLAKDPSARFGSAWEAFLALEGVEGGDGGMVIALPAASNTFVFHTLTGIVPSFDGPTGEVGPGRQELPTTGFAVRRARPRLPTTRLFARRAEPCVGHHEVRQQLWDAARRALENGEAIRVGVRVDQGQDLEGLVESLVVRLRELGVRAGQHLDHEMVVQVGTRLPPAPSLLIERREEGPLAMDRLHHVELVAWLQAQVRLEPDLAWEIARRAFGSVELARALLREVLKLPLVPDGEGLRLAGVLPVLMRPERERWSQHRISRGLAWAAVLIEGFDPALHAQLAGETPDLWRVARLVKGRWTLADGLRVVVREQLRDRGELAAMHREAAARTSGERQALHRLYGGMPGARKALMEALAGRMTPLHPPDKHLLAGAGLAIDLDLLPVGHRDRERLADAVALREFALGRGMSERIAPYLESADPLAEAKRLPAEQALAAVEEVLSWARGPLFVRAITRAARLELELGRVDEALVRAEEGLDFLVGTAWPEPRALLEAVRLAATAHEAGDAWELLWLARSRRDLNAVRGVLELAAGRAEAAGLGERARRLRVGSVAG